MLQQIIHGGGGIHLQKLGCLRHIQDAPIGLYAEPEFAATAHRQQRQPMRHAASARWITLVFLVHRWGSLSSNCTLSATFDSCLEAWLLQGHCETLCLVAVGGKDPTG